MRSGYNYICPRFALDAGDGKAADEVLQADDVVEKAADSKE